MTWTNLQHGGGGNSSISTEVIGTQTAGLEGTLGEAGAEGVEEGHDEAEELGGETEEGREDVENREACCISR